MANNKKRTLGKMTPLSWFALMVVSGITSGVITALILNNWNLRLNQEILKQKTEALAQAQECPYLGKYQAVR